MLRSVYKYELVPNAQGRYILEMPLNATPLCVQVQYEKVQLWALVDVEQQQTVDRIFHIAGTGHNIEEKHLKYIDTFQLYGGSLVFHVFEINPPRSHRHRSNLVKGNPPC